MMTELRNASRRGVPIVAINPLRERALERFANPQNAIEMAVLGSTPIASEYCQLRIGGDIALLKGIMKCVLDAHDQAQDQGLAKAGHAAIDAEFIEQHTQGFLAFAQDLRLTEWDWILQASGVPREQIERIANIYLHARNVIVAYGSDLDIQDGRIQVDRKSVV